MSERTIRHRDDGPSRYLGPVRSTPGDEHTVDADTGEYLVDETGYFEYVDTPDSDDDGDDEPTCAGKDAECTRPVDAEGEYCWQHQPDDEDEDEDEEE